MIILDKGHINQFYQPKDQCILVEIALLLVVVEKLSFFESAILKFFLQKNFFFFASFPSKLLNIYGKARIFQNFDDYPSFHKISGVPILALLTQCMC